MRFLIITALAGGLGLGAVPASAQSLNDIGRAVQDQVLGTRPPPERNRDAYQRGREDQMREQARRHDEFRQDREARRNDEYRHERDARRYDERRDEGDRFDRRRDEER